MATISEAFQIAIRHHQAGQLDLAEQIYRQILKAEPNHADSLHLLGLIAYQQGQFPTALELIGRAVALNPSADVYHNSLGLTYQGLGNSGEAIACYRRALQLNPQAAGTHNNLGNALRDEKKLDEAIAAYRQALQLSPGLAEAHNNLGNALHAQGKLDEAIAAYRQALQVNPSYAEAHNNLGNALWDAGKSDEGIASYHRALQLRPDFAEALDNLSNAMYQQGKLDEAIGLSRRALVLNPHYFPAHISLGNALRSQGRLDEAVESYRKALELNPDYAIAHNNLGTALKEQGKRDEAIACYEQALLLKPDYAEAHSNLGTCLSDQGNLDAAIASYQQALLLNPDYAEGHNNLGVAFYDGGRPDEAMACYQQALRLKPDYALAHSNYLNALHYRPQVTQAELLEAHLEYDRRHAAPLRAAWRPHENAADPERPLRLGFVSPSFAWRPVARFLVRVLENLDRRQSIIACYSDRASQDEMTARFQAVSTIWRDVLGVADAALAEQIRADRIDILFDLAGHTGPNRLLVFARKPAPIQITWLDYEGTTGLSAMDYLLADRYEVPPEADRWYCEKVLRLPDDYACYDAPADAPAVGPLPALANGLVTFGSFNLPSKFTPQVVATWARIFRQVPDARIILKYAGLDRPAGGAHFRQLFADQGIAPERVELQGWSPYNEMLACYHQVDVALDPFPYNGGLTTCDALWMGVPVITCPGQTFASRHGLSHLSNAGLTETIAGDLEEYADLAVSLARDLPRLAEIRARLRAQMAASPLCDGKRLADNLLQLLRGVWRDWCTGLRQFDGAEGPSD